MKIIENIKVPTGNILIIEGDKGKLECLSLGDYGKEANVKANFLGLDRELNGVPNGDVMPLENKWVVTLSTQYGCSSKCKFCDCPKVGAGVNATYDDLKNQILTALSLHPEVTHTKRLNIHYARMGEPSWNPNVIDVSYDLHDIISDRLGDSLVHPVFTTMLPKANKRLESVVVEWADWVKNKTYSGNAGLQLSINSTNDEQRNDMFGGSSSSLAEISKIGDKLSMPKGRKYCLNFALADNYEVDAKKLKALFDPEKFMVKITPLHMTHACVDNNIKTTNGYEYFTPYQHVEAELIDAGFDVLVFVPSKDEDEGRITCGNAILSGTMPECKYSIEN